MRPHIKRIGGLWYCAGDGILTFSFKPWDAYCDWLRTQRHAALEQINQILGQGL